ncbi:NUDIX hydrolase [Deinococcus irradiatisoli]|uniref:NUDIX hydrolase n=1 Tax=Deinococcus irradiatisoli TaxID=2202254 RepID=UPI001FE27E8E|nr:NUDIX hydrolase [Deinococcus irradiatisoli]
MPDHTPKGKAPGARPASAAANPNAPQPTATPATTPGTQNRSRNRNRHRNRNRSTPGENRPRNEGRGEVQPPITAPPSRGRNKRPLAEPRIGVGCIVMRGDEVLIVRERGRWSLPKGGLEVGELVQDGARRETYEETGLIVELRELAFMVEFQAETWGHHIQFFYVGREIGGTLGPRDPDRDVQEAKFVSVRHLREYLRFRPRLVALESWLRDRRPKHFVFNLDKEPAMLRKRTRVDTGRAAAARKEDQLERLTFEAEDELP